MVSRKSNIRNLGVGKNFPGQKNVLKIWCWRKRSVSVKFYQISGVGENFPGRRNRTENLVSEKIYS